MPSLMTSMRGALPLGLLALAGCASAPGGMQTVRVAVPLVCSERAPERPHMPTESLRPDAGLDAFAAAAIAEIERREGYEIQLRTALSACTNPLKVGK